MNNRKARLLLGVPVTQSERVRWFRVSNRLKLIIYSDGKVYGFWTKPTQRKNRNLLRFVRRREEAHARWHNLGFNFDRADYVEGLFGGGQ